MVKAYLLVQQTSPEEANKLLCTADGARRVAHDNIMNLLRVEQNTGLAHEVLKGSNYNKKKRTAPVADPREYDEEFIDDSAEDMEDGQGEGGAGHGHGAGAANIPPAKTPASASPMAAAMGANSDFSTYDSIRFFAESKLIPSGGLDLLNGKLYLLFRMDSNVIMRYMCDANAANPTINFKFVFPRPDPAELTALGITANTILPDVPVLKTSVPIDAAVDLTVAPERFEKGCWKGCVFKLRLQARAPTVTGIYSG